MIDLDSYTLSIVKKWREFHQKRITEETFVNSVEELHSITELLLKEIRDFIRELKVEAEAKRLIGDGPITIGNARLQVFQCLERLARYTEYKREHLL